MMEGKSNNNSKHFVETMLKTTVVYGPIEVAYFVLVVVMLYCYRYIMLYFFVTYIDICHKTIRVCLMSLLMQVGPVSRMDGLTYTRLLVSNGGLTDNTYG